jgi:hypothetical protein
MIKILIKGGRFDSFALTKVFSHQTVDYGNKQDNN